MTMDIFRALSTGNIGNVSVEQITAVASGTSPSLARPSDST